MTTKSAALEHGPPTKPAHGQHNQRIVAVSTVAQKTPANVGDVEFSFGAAVRWSLVVVKLAPGAFVASTVLTLLATLLAQYSAQLLINLIDALRGNGNGTNTVVVQAGLYLIVAITLVAARYSGRVLTGWSSALMTARLQQRLHDGLLRLDSTFHDRHDVGELSAIVLQSSGGAQQTFADLAAFPLDQGIPLVAAIWFLLSNLGKIQAISAGTQVVIVLLLLFVPVAGWRLATMLRAAAGAAQGALVALSSEFINSAANPLEVRIMGAMPQRSAAFAGRLQTMVAARLATTLRLAAASEFGSSLPVLVAAAMLLYAAWVMTAPGSTASAGALVGVVLFIPYVMAPVQNLLSFNIGLQASWPQIAQVGALLDARPVEPPGTLELGAGNPIALERVRLAYGNGRTVLDDLTYVFPPGAITAIVGRSGSGKSSILNLVNGSRMPSEGSVCIAGVPIGQARLDALRRRIATVSQFPLFISDTARQNFRLAKPDATDAEIEAVARKTGLWQVLEREAPQAPLELMIPRAPGQGLSGGQRRLFAITRALLCQPDVMLLDEPTTGVDPLGVAALAEQLPRLLAGMTVIMVEHDMSFVQRVAGNICCLQDGLFVETGSPADLAAGHSVFAQLLSIQNSLTNTEGLDIQSVGPPEIQGLKRKENG